MVLFLIQVNIQGQLINKPVCHNGYINSHKMYPLILSDTIQMVFLFPDLLDFAISSGPTAITLTGDWREKPGGTILQVKN